MTMLPSISARRTLPCVRFQSAVAENTSAWIHEPMARTPALKRTVWRSIRSTKISSFVLRIPERASASCTGLLAE